MYTPESQGPGEDLQSWVHRELNRISAEFKLAQDGMDLPVRTVEPPKRRHGQLAIADGTNWNPGGGFGLYIYNAGTASWTKL